MAIINCSLTIQIISNATVKGQIGSSLLIPIYDFYVKAQELNFIALARKTDFIAPDGNTNFIYNINTERRW